MSKILACHQPGFFPYLGYWEKLLVADVFVWMDDVLYKRRDYINRCQITTQHGVKWLTVPILKEEYGKTKINDIIFDYPRIMEVVHTIQGSYANDKVNEIMSRVLTPDVRSLCEVCYRSLNEAMRWLAYPTRIGLHLASSLELKSDSTQRIIDYCKNFECNIYFSGGGARAYLNEKLMNDNGIKVVWQESPKVKYDQKWAHHDFVPYMSILDAMLNNADLSGFVYQCNQLHERIKNGS